MYPAWSLDEARRHARELIVQMDRGLDPRVEARKRMTLREGVAEYAAHLRRRRRSVRTIDSLTKETDLYGGVLLDP